ncbi:cytochrome P450 [Frankia sp. AgB1.9]|uniref:cytochrome P450 n=1 Tax=unclassified Frankia TaxID=2632575 RepID=UPI001931DB39|nr:MULTISPECIES: cytochrome P450 [unclassified Frankia]MBL7486859.1 cytochrome P450 [Frankia sp. AgW1.1]MBL7549768.1 cytochrome P450 [Frankia sp. AgB1.9]MBL7622922.1 cytochrome P450 [Frankia sp. AgB1.8]
MTVETYDLNPETFQAMAQHDVLTRLRAQDPVHWTVDADGKGFWSLTRHADIQLANRDVDTFTVTRGFTLIDVDQDPFQGAAMLEMLPGLGPERHARHRRIVSRGFTPRVLGLLEDHLRLKARLIVDNVIARGRADFVDEIAAELPLQAICELVGVPERDRRQMFAWGNAMTGVDDPNVGDREAGMRASAGLIGYGQSLRADRLRDPADDIVTRLTQAAVVDDGLTDAEFGMFFVLLIVAGNETTRNATAHGMRALLENPEQLAKLRADHSSERMATAVEEILRWSTPIQYFRRTATRDVELRGRTIRAGDWVVLWYPSANRDEDVFPDPFTFDVDRTPNDHVTFGGGGPHFCLGANLARLELRLILTEIITRMPHLRLDGPVELLRSNFVSGVTHMPVRWDEPRPGAGS